MVLDLINKLLDRLIELAKLRKQIQKERFQSFVQETFVEFEAIHKHYVQSFRAYRQRLADGSENLQAIIDAIREECLFTEHQRSRLRQWSNVLATESTQYGLFFSVIYEYLASAHNIGGNTLPPNYFAPTGQIWFTGLVDTLVALDTLVKGGDANEVSTSLSRDVAIEALETTKDERKAAIYIVDSYTNWLQNCFANVSREYTKLKQKAL